MDSVWIVLAATLAPVAAYLAFVNPRIQHYRGRFFIAAPPDEVADALVPIPGQPYLTDKIAVEAVDDDARDMCVVMPNGSEVRVRIIEDDRPRHIVFEGVSRASPTAPWGDRMYSRESVAAAPGGSFVDYAIRIERTALTRGFLKRLAHPFQGRLYRWGVEAEIDRRRRTRKAGPWG